MTAEGLIRYFARTGDVDREISIVAGSLVVDGEALDADVSSLPGSDRQHLRVDGRSLTLFARREDANWVIELEGRPSSR